MSKKGGFKVENNQRYFIKPVEITRARVTRSKVLIFFIGAAAIYFLFSISNLLLADISYAAGRNLNEIGEYAQAIEYFEEAVKLNPYETAYHRDYAYALAKLAKEESRENYSEMAAKEAQIAYQLNPKNSLTLKKLLSVYYTLSEIGPKYNANLLQMSLETTNLVPTEPRPHYDQALIFVKLGLKEKALESVSKALNLKSDYPEAIQLEEILISDD